VWNNNQQIKKHRQHNYNRNKVLRQVLTQEQMNKMLNSIMPEGFEDFKPLAFEKMFKKSKTMVILNKKKWSNLTNRVIHIWKSFQKFKQPSCTPAVFRKEKYFFDLNMRTALLKLRRFNKTEYNYMALRTFIQTKAASKYKAKPKDNPTWRNRMACKLNFNIMKPFLALQRLFKKTGSTHDTLAALRTIRRKTEARLHHAIAELVKFKEAVWSLPNKIFKESPKICKLETPHVLKTCGKFNMFPVLTRLLFIGGSSEKTNAIFLSAVFFSKNNIDILRASFVRIHILKLYATFRWLLSAKMSLSFYKAFRFMFASTTAVFAKLMRWAAEQTAGLFSANRWLSGKLSGSIQIEHLPNYLFIPDIDENALIIREAIKQNVAVIAVVSTDSSYNIDVPVFGNNKEFKVIVQVLRLLIYLSKHKQHQINKSVNILLSSPKWFKLGKQNSMFSKNKKSNVTNFKRTRKNYQFSCNYGSSGAV
jgi:hypothetical protein